MKTLKDFLNENEIKSEEGSVLDPDELEKTIDEFEDADDRLITKKDEKMSDKIQDDLDSMKDDLEEAFPVLYDNEKTYRPNKYKLPRWIVSTIQSVDRNIAVQAMFNDFISEFEMRLPEETEKFFGNRMEVLTKLYKDPMALYKSFSTKAKSDSSSIGSWAKQSATYIPLMFFAGLIQFCNPYEVERILLGMFSNKDFIDMLNNKQITESRKTLADFLVDSNKVITELTDRNLLDVLSYASSGETVDVFVENKKYTINQKTAKSLLESFGCLEESSRRKAYKVLTESHKSFEKYLQLL